METTNYNSLCNPLLKKKIIKCITKKNECYIFIGNSIHYKGIIQQFNKNIEKNIEIFNRKDENGQDTYNDEDLIKFYNIISDKYIDKDDYTGETIDMIQDYIHKEFLFDKKKYTIHFVTDDIIHEDDTIENVMNKICIHCTDEKIYYPYIYSWFMNHENKHQSFGYNYNNRYKIIEFNDIFNKKIADNVDQNFIDEDSNKINVTINNEFDNLFNIYELKDNILYFFTIHEYIQNKKSEINELKSENYFYKIYENGLLRKYWPKLSNFQELIIDKHEYLKIKKSLEIYSKNIQLIEDNYNPKESYCHNFSIEKLRVIKEDDSNNSIQLKKLFSDYQLSFTNPFIKLILDTYENKYYKLYNESLINYENGLITKDLIKSWTEDYQLQPKMGYQYLHSENIIIFKLYNIELGMFISLILHMNGTIECIIDDEINMINEKNLVLLLEQCNDFIKEINKKKVYSYQRKSIILFDTKENDFIRNNNSKTKIDFLNCSFNYDNQLFKNKDDDELKYWNVPIEKQKVNPKKKVEKNPNFHTFLSNHPMYVRLRLEEEYLIQSKEVLELTYKRINNYKNISNIESKISYYSNPLNLKTYDKGQIINLISTDFNISQGSANEYYNEWEKIAEVKRTHGKKVYSKDIIEPGSDIIIMNNYGKLEIQIINMKSFLELRNIIIFMKTMIHLYIKSLKVKKTKKKYNNFLYVNNYDFEKMLSDDSDETAYTISLLKDLSDSGEPEKESSSIESGEPEKESSSIDSGEPEKESSSIDSGEPQGSPKKDISSSSSESG